MKSASTPAADGKKPQPATAAKARATRVSEVVEEVVSYTKH